MKAKCREYVPVIKWHVASAFDIEPIEPNIGIDRWYKSVIFEWKHNPKKTHTTPFKFTTPESKSNWKNERDYAKSTANKDKGKHHQESWENNRLNVENE